MNTKKFLKLFALITVFALLLAACGAKTETPDATGAAPAASGELDLADWSMDATIWSGSNGAAIDLTAVPNAYAEGQTASFVVRLEGEEVWNIPCEWNGESYTAYADLNAEDGYCYYVVLTAADGTQVTVDVNTPNKPYNESLINLAASLESYCSATVSEATYEGGILSIDKGTAVIQVPQITSDGKLLTVSEARLILNLDGGAQDQTLLDLPAEASTDGTYTVDLTNICFQVPELEGDHQLTLTLLAELSDGHTMEDSGNTSWFYSDGAVHLTVG